MSASPSLLGFAPSLAPRRSALGSHVCVRGVADDAARQYWDGMNRRDVEHALAQFSDDIQFQDLLFPSDKRGKKELRQHFETCLEGFPAGLRFEIDEVCTASLRPKEDSRIGGAASIVRFPQESALTGEHLNPKPST
ncbi:hypothetical protein T484DRAFT_2979173 [Baffinella frigidus]|nr:hypothetical protein T484DRAFT_2979173 [Cryptophyta sp. CCMP2293]